VPPVPLARYRFDEAEGATSYDAMGLAPAGNLVNFTAAPWTQGHADGALSFDGRDDFVQVGDLGPIRTVSLWLKPETTHVTSSHTENLLPSAHGPLDQWISPELAYADDGREALTAALLGIYHQHWRGFHVAEQLPADARIRGVTVTVDTGNLGLLGYFAVELSSDEGASHTAAQYTWAQLIAGSNSRQAGGPDRLWGRTWTSADFLDENFVERGSFGGIANAMNVDYLAVQLHYDEQATPRSVLSLTEGTRVTFADGGSMALAITGWPGARVYVNGQLDAELALDWNHVVITASNPKRASDLRVGAAPSAFLDAPFQGAMDDLMLFEAELAPAQLGGSDAGAGGCFPFAP
jgi:hypothetical protein